MVSDESISKIKKFTESKPKTSIYAKSNNLLPNGVTSVPQSFLLDKKEKKVYHPPTIFEETKDEVSFQIKNWIKN